MKLSHDEGGGGDASWTTQKKRVIELHLLKIRVTPARAFQCNWGRNVLNFCFWEPAFCFFFFFFFFFGVDTGCTCLIDASAQLPHIRQLLLLLLLTLKTQLLTFNKSHVLSALLCELGWTFAADMRHVELNHCKILIPFLRATTSVPQGRRGGTVSECCVASKVRLSCYVLRFRHESNIRAVVVLLVL